MTDLGPDTITILNAELVADVRDNTEYRDWANAEETVVTGCFLQPFLLSTKLQYEYTQDREYTTTFFQLFAPYGAPLGAHSRVEFDGLTYEVQGNPGKWRDFEGSHHMEAVLKLREG